MPLIDFADVTSASQPERPRIDFSDVAGAAPPAAAPPRETPRNWRELKGFAEQAGFFVTSTTGGGHNTGSAHYAGLAVDVKTRDKRPEDVERFMRLARLSGINVRDERVRPRGQRVWGGPHVHLQVGNPKAAAPAVKQKPRVIDFSDVTIASK